MPVLAFYAHAAEYSGGVFVAAGDVDADGRAEIVAGAGPGASATVAALRRLPDGSFTVVTSFTAYAPTFGGGVFVSGMTR
jgi:hypothetical protein